MEHTYKKRTANILEAILGSMSDHLALALAFLMLPCLLVSKFMSFLRCGVLTQVCVIVQIKYIRIYTRVARIRAVVLWFLSIIVVVVVNFGDAMEIIRRIKLNSCIKVTSYVENILAYLPHQCTSSNLHIWHTCDI